MPNVIEVRNLSKEYRIGGVKARNETFREFLVKTLKRPLRAFSNSENSGRDQSFWALRDINFDITEGEVVGIIGRNGAGKSTLLKIISRITDPTDGYIRVRGRLASLLEVGTGFHPELTGRENIFLNGAILGMSRAEILSKFDEIVAFSEIERFLDTPVKRYSSGMYIRLAFSVAAHLNPEILVVDEVLAVGDMAFQKKCLGKMNDVSRSGRTILFVSHNISAIEHLCQRGIVLTQGKLAFSGTAKEAVQYYVHRAMGDTDIGASGNCVDLSQAPGRWAERRPLLRQLEFCPEDGKSLKAGVRVGAPLTIRVHFILPAPTSSFDIGLGFENLLGQRVFTAHTAFEPVRGHNQVTGPQVFACEIPSLTLVPGEYVLRVWMDIGQGEVDKIDNAARFEVIPSDYYGTGKSPWNGVFVLKHHWHLVDPKENSTYAASEALPAAEPPLS
jgi:homopolymeric O-antigen transport system ATP-binding protein